MIDAVVGQSDHQAAYARCVDEERFATMRQLETWAASNENLDRENKRLADQLRNAVDERDAMLASASWRFTRPLRVTMKLLRKIGLGSTARRRKQS